jgi:hypothetical protein
MNIYIQWTTDPASGWIKIDSKDWALLPQKLEPVFDRTPVYDRPEPIRPQVLAATGISCRVPTTIVEPRIIGFTGTREIIDNQPGWIYRLCVQGMVFSKDHIAVIDHENYVEVVEWNDDSGDSSSSEFCAEEWDLYPKIVDRTYRDGRSAYRFQGFLQVRRRYGNFKDEDFTSGGLTTNAPYSSFVPPTHDLVRHSIWLPQDLCDQLDNYDPPTWHEWI